MNCVKCGAALPGKSLLCSYCGALNDVDLRAIQAVARKGPATGRRCPRCAVLMESIDVGRGRPLFVERCEKCLGLFFAPGELEQLIDASVSRVFEVDYERMGVILEEEAVERFPGVRYLKCPVCAEPMNRKLYGARSGVKLDVCRADGVWVDGGELAQLLKWVKAGGKVHDAEVRLEEANRALRKRQQRLRELEAQRQEVPYGFSASAAAGGLTTAILLLCRLLRN